MEVQVLLGTQMKKILTILLLVLIGGLVLSSFFTRTIYVKSEGIEEPEKEKIPPQHLRLVPNLKNDLVSQQKDFLEVNFTDMRARVYKNNKLAEEAPLLTIGDPNSWGGSAVGLYSIISGHKESYSVISDVFMPHALNYYGKYYLHGEPYYSNGTKLVSSVSGGCIRLRDEDAQRIYNTVETNMPILVINKERDLFQYPEKKMTAIRVTADKYLVADLDSGYILAQKNSDEVWPIASLTKLMTATTITENIDLRKSVQIQEEMFSPYGFTDVLQEGRRFGVVELLYPLLIESSNDSAKALTYFLGQKRTIEMMNEKAQSIMMPNTKFVDPHGYSPKNVSTAQEIFQLARYINNNRPPIFKITRGGSVPTFRSMHFEINELWNKNIFSDDPSFIGGKTGFIKQSGYNGLFIFRFKTDQGIERDIAIIILNSKSDKSDVQSIYRWLMDNYSLSPIEA